MVLTGGGSGPPSILHLARSARPPRLAQQRSAAEMLTLHDGVARPSRAAEIHPLGLSEGDKDDLLAFLDTLDTGRTPPD